MKEKMKEYFETKDIPKRNKLLRELALNYPPDAKDFFYRAFKRERYLDMRLTAIRGYAFYASEEEVEIVMSKMLELLKRRPERTPYDYQEYEPMRSKFLMPYLIERYDYQCFKDFNEQLEKQYNAMPDVFKNIYSVDEYGNSYAIRDPKEVTETFDKFYEERRRKEKAQQSG